MNAAEEMRERPFCERCVGNGVVFYNEDGSKFIHGHTVTIPCRACRPDDYEKWHTLHFPAPALVDNP